MEEKSSFVFVPIEIRGIKEKEIIQELLKQRAQLEKQLEYAKDMLKYYITTNKEINEVFDKLEEIKNEF